MRVVKTMLVVRAAVAIAAAMLAGCAVWPETSGSGVLLNMTPAPPVFTGSYDFDLMGRVTGQSCSVRGTRTTDYWVAINELSKISSDGLTRRAIAAAAFDAIAKVTNADAIVLTRVLAEGKGAHKVCATVYGRAVRLTKARPVAPSLPVAPPLPSPPTSDDIDEGEDEE